MCPNYCTHSLHSWEKELGTRDSSRRVPSLCVLPSDCSSLIQARSPHPPPSPACGIEVVKSNFFPPSSPSFKEWSSLPFTIILFLCHLSNPHCFSTFSCPFCSLSHPRSTCRIGSPSPLPSPIQSILFQSGSFHIIDGLLSHSSLFDNFIPLSS